MNRILASTLNLVVAFVATNMLMQFMIYILAGGLGYEPTFSYGSIITITDFHKWTRPNVIEVYFFPPVIMLILGLLMYRAMYKQVHSWGRLQLLGYWTMICAINIFFAQLFFAPLGVSDTRSVFYETMAIVEVWLRLPAEIAAAICVFSCIATILAGYLLVIETVKLSYSHKLVADTTGKNILIVQMYIIPIFLAALPVLLLARGQAHLRIGATLINLLLFPLGMFLRNSISPYRVRFEKASISSRFPLSMILICAGICGIIYIFLS